MGRDGHPFKYMYLKYYFVFSIFVYLLIQETGSLIKRLIGKNYFMYFENTKILRLHLFKYKTQNSSMGSISYTCIYVYEILPIPDYG